VGEGVLVEIFGKSKYSRTALRGESVTAEDELGKMEKEPTPRPTPIAYVAHGNVDQYVCYLLIS
jgi:hypothetical protein